MSGQKIRQKTCTKYLSVLLDKLLLFKDHINTLKQKLNRENGILAKMRDHLLSFGDKATMTLLVMVQRAQNKALRIINFKEEVHPSEPHHLAK